jgi:hypothetical protein
VSSLHHVQSQLATWPRRLLPAATVAILGITALLPHLSIPPDRGLLELTVTAGWLGVAAFVLGVRYGRRLFAEPDRTEDRRGSSMAVQLALYLSPVVLLSIVFPIASRRLVGAEVGGESISTLLLASAVTVPWLSQAVCLPLYRSLGALAETGTRSEIDERFVAVWPGLFAKSTPVVLLFVVAVEAAHAWSGRALATYVALCLLHVLFSQALVPGNIRSDRVLWAAAWTGYATALLLAPTRWYLPPLVGIATQVVPIAVRWRFRPIRFQAVPVVTDLATGLLLGSVLWVDKFMLFLRASDTFAVSAVFVALLPAVLAYNYYFVRLAPVINRSVSELRRAMETQPHAQLAERSRELALGIAGSIHRTALVGAGLGLTVTVIVAGTYASLTSVVAAVSVASWLFMLITILSYKLSYIGQQRPALAASAIHLVLTVTILSTATSIPEAYRWLALLDVPALALVWFGCARQWRTAEYAFFWRHATAW